MRRRHTGPSKDAAAIVDARAGGWCEWPGCTRQMTDRHHRLNRKAGGRYGAMSARINSPSWLLGCCRGHHNLVTSPIGDERELAESSGWLLREGQDAAEVPVLTRHWAESIWLDDDGCWETIVGRTARGAA